MIICRLPIGTPLKQPWPIAILSALYAKLRSDRLYLLKNWNHEKRCRYTLTRRRIVGYGDCGLAFLEFCLRRTYIFRTHGIGNSNFTDKMYILFYFYFLSSKIVKFILTIPCCTTRFCILKGEEKLKYTFCWVTLVCYTYYNTYTQSAHGPRLASRTRVE